jgi:hypothetical protein
VLNLPVSGSLDDPQFNFQTVVYRALETALLKIVTSPFAALSSLFGGKGEELSFQEFQPGSTNLLPVAMANLDILAKALYERPELQLEIEGSVDPVADLAALRLDKLHHQLPEQKSKPLLFAADISRDTEATPQVRTLWRTAPNQKGAAALRSSVPFWTTVTNWPGPAETNVSTHLRMFADERGATALMRVITPQAPREDLDHGSELQSVELPPRALPALANERAGTVRTYLIQTGRVQQQRITETARGASSKGSRVYLWLQ